MMMFSAISYGVTKEEDQRRIMALGMVKDNNQERFRRLQQMVGETLTVEYADAFLARSIRMIPVIRQNALVFAPAIAAKLG